MARRVSLLAWWFLTWALLGQASSLVQINSIVNTTGDSVVLIVPEGSIQIYPREDYVVETCHDTAWMNWKLHRTPPEFNPLHWTRSQWRSYLLHYPLRSAGLSIALLLIGVFALSVSILWRCVQWCVGCGRCRRACSVGAEETGFLGDTKHTYLKAWIFLLLAGALSMAIWGMIALDKQLLTTFWAAVLDILDYGKMVTNNLGSLQDRLAVEFPQNVTRAGRVVNETMAPEQLLPNVQMGYNFAVAGSALTSSLQSNATAIASSLKDAVLPGLTALGAQLGVSSASTAHRRRQLAQASSSLPSYDTLASLLPALTSGLPRIAGAENNRTAIRDGLQVLLAAIDSLLAETNSSPNSSAVVGLQAALQATTLGQWEGTLNNLATAFQVYNASRSGTAFSAVTTAGNAVATGSQTLSQPAVNQVASFLTAIKLLLDKGPLRAMLDLQDQFLNISTNVVDTSSWTVGLKNGTQIPIRNLTDRMAQYMTGVYGMAPNPSSSNGSQTAQSTRSTSSASSNFTQALQNTSSLVTSISNSVSLLASQTAATASSASAGPDPGPALNQTTSAMLPSLASLEGPTATISAALNTYTQSPTPSNLAAVRAAALDSRAPIAAAADAFSVPLINASRLSDTALGLLKYVYSLSGSSSELQPEVPTALAALSTFASSDLETFEQNVGGLASAIGQLPMLEEIQHSVLDAVEHVQGTIAEISQDVAARVNGTTTALNDTASRLQSQVLQKGQNFITTNQQRTEDIIDIVYPIWMAVYGFFIFLVLLLVLAVAINWPAGLITVGLLLLALITASQALTSAIAFGMALVEDGCSNIEEVAMTQTVEYSGNPQIAVLMSYYLYHVPDDRDIMIQAALGVNVTNVTLGLQDLGVTLNARLDNSTSPFRGLARSVLQGVALAASKVASLYVDILLMMNYDTIHSLYVNTKKSVCCDAGNVAYIQWCAITAAACLCFGALIPTWYLLARMDMLRERRRQCCSCCTCVCYRPKNRYNAETEEEDRFAKEARKQQEILLHQQLALQQIQQQQQQQRQQQQQMHAHGFPVTPGSSPAGKGSALGPAADAEAPSAPPLPMTMATP